MARALLEGLHDDLVHMGREWTALRRGVGRLLVAAALWLAARAQWISLAGAYVAGWASLTWGVAGIVARIVGEPIPEVWGLSLGVFLLSMGGLGLLRDIAVDGLWVLSKGRKS